MRALIVFIIWLSVIVLIMAVGGKISSGSSMSGDGYRMDNVRIEWQ